MAKGKGKKAKARRSAAPAKVPKAAAQESSQRETPHFCFRYADRATREAWAFKPSEEHAPSLFEFICNITTSTWGEIENQTTGGFRRHKKHHSQPIGSVCADARADYNKRQLGETFGEMIFRFRLSGEQRLWGFRRSRVFHVVWWDPDHAVYPTEPD